MLPARQATQLCKGFPKSLTSEHPRGRLKGLGGHQAFKIRLDAQPCNSQRTMVLTQNLGLSSKTKFFRQQTSFRLHKQPAGLCSALLSRVRNTHAKNSHKIMCSRCKAQTTPHTWVHGLIPRGGHYYLHLADEEIELKEMQIHTTGRQQRWGLKSGASLYHAKLGMNPSRTCCLRHYKALSPDMEVQGKFHGAVHVKPRALDTYILPPTDLGRIPARAGGEGQGPTAVGITPQRLPQSCLFRQESVNWEFCVEHPQNPLSFIRIVVSASNNYLTCTPSLPHSLLLWEQ